MRLADLHDQPSEVDTLHRENRRNWTNRASPLLLRGTDGCPAMSPPYSNNFKARRNPFDNDRGSALNHVLRSVKRLVSRAASSAYTFSRGNGAKMAAGFVTRTVWHVRRNLTRRRLLSFPHLIVLLWLLVLLRGERWLFHWKVEQCKWHKWEDWVCAFLSLGCPCLDFGN